MKFLLQKVSLNNGEYIIEGRVGDLQIATRISYSQGSDRAANAAWTLFESEMAKAVKARFTELPL